MKQALIILAIHVSILIALNAVAATPSLDQLTSSNSSSQSIELTCKSQAKDIAMKTYNNCMTEARNREIEDIRSNYKKELQALKSKYEGRIQALNPEKAKPNKLTQTNKVTIQNNLRNENKADLSTPEALPLSKNGSDLNIQKESTAPEESQQLDSFQAQ